MDANAEATLELLRKYELGMRVGQTHPIVLVIRDIPREGGELEKLQEGLHALQDGLIFDPYMFPGTYRLAVCPDEENLKHETDNSVTRLLTRMADHGINYPGSESFRSAHRNP